VHQLEIKVLQKL